MTEHQLSLAPFYAGWDVYQQHLVAAIAPLTAEQLALRSSPQNWSVGMIATHIIAVRVGWFHMWMGAGDAELAALGEWDEDGQPTRSAAELVTGLDRKSTRLNSSHQIISYAVFCLKKKNLCTDLTEQATYRFMRS